MLLLAHGLVSGGGDFQNAKGKAQKTALYCILQKNKKNKL